MIRFICFLAFFALSALSAEEVVPGSEAGSPVESAPGQAKESIAPESPSPEPGADAPPQRMFIGTSLIHMPTTEQVGGGDLDFHFDHRFGDAKNTLGDFFGFDQGANTRLSLEYGIFDRWSVGIARISAARTYEAQTRLAVYQGRPFGIPAAFSVMGVAGQETEQQVVDLYPQISYANTGNAVIDQALNQRLNQYTLSSSDRRSYLAAGMFSVMPWDRFSFQISPMFLHRNFVKPGISNDRPGLDLGGRIRITKRVDIMLETVLTAHRDYLASNYALEDQRSKYGTELTASDINARYLSPQGLLYAYVVNVVQDQPVRYASIPASIGINIDTGGHIFQLIVTNSRDLAYTTLLRGAAYDYRKHDWAVGFNIHRFFSP